MDHSSEPVGTSAGMSPEEGRENAWREVQLDIDLFKFYLDLLLTGATLSLGITGALLSYILQNTTPESLLRYALLIPLIMNGGMAVVCGLSVSAAKSLAAEHVPVCLRAGIPKPYDLNSLPTMLQLFAGVFGAVAIAILIIFIRG